MATPGSEPRPAGSAPSRRPAEPQEGHQPPRESQAQGGEASPAQDVRAAAQQASERAGSYLATQKNALADGIDGLARALHGAAREVESHDAAGAAWYADEAANRLDRFAATLRDRDLGSLVSEASDFARREPALFVGGSVLVGFLLARFLKSSRASAGMPDPTTRQHQAFVGGPTDAIPAVPGGYGGMHLEDYGDETA